MQKILILLCRSIICQNILATVLWHKDAFWNHYRDKINDSAIETNHDGNKINKNETTTSKLFDYKTKIMGSTQTIIIH